jgi:hypothetical protein
LGYYTGDIVYILHNAPAPKIKDGYVWPSDETTDDASVDSNSSSKKKKGKKH